MAYERQKHRRWDTSIISPIQEALGRASGHETCRGVDVPPQLRHRRAALNHHVQAWAVAHLEERAADRYRQVPHYSVCCETSPDLVMDRLEGLSVDDYSAIKGTHGEMTRYPHEAPHIPATEERIGIRLRGGRRAVQKGERKGFMRGYYLPASYPPTSGSPPN